jgi:Fe-S cluster assembly protein SufD
MATVAPHRPEVAEQAPTTQYLHDWERFSATLPATERRELRELRRAAIGRFGEVGFPSLRQEEWRFTNLAPLSRLSFVRPDRGSAAATEWAAEHLKALSFPAAARLVFIDGAFSPALSSRDGLPEGVRVESLAGSLQGPAAPAVVDHLARYAEFTAGPFVALNTAFMADGALIVLPRGTRVEQPIHVVYLSGAQGGPATVSYPRVLLVAEEHSQATVVESYAGEGSYFSCGVTELVAGPEAVIDHYKVQRESREAYHLATFQLYCDRAANVTSHSISLGGHLVRNDVNAVLDGSGIDCILNGLYVVDGRQHIDNHMRVEHAKPHCASHELYKGILDGKARSVFNGLIYVHKVAQKTDAKQSNRNLLLSADAIANSNPQLEIFADDVKCTHGSTVGQLDDDAVFYLRSRGIGEEASRSLLTYAFASELVERIRVEAVRRDLEEFLFARLPLGEVVRQAI